MPFLGGFYGALKIAFTRIILENKRIRMSLFLWPLPSLCSLYLDFSLWESHIFSLFEMFYGLRDSHGGITKPPDGRVITDFWRQPIQSVFYRKLSDSPLQTEASFAYFTSLDGLWLPYKGPILDGSPWRNVEIVTHYSDRFLRVLLWEFSASPWTLNATSLVIISVIRMSLPPVLAVLP